jgi:hypothetical protein
MAKTATLVKEQMSPVGAVQKLYRLNEAVHWGGDYEGDEVGHSEYVLVSAVDAMFTGPETYIFPADAEGNVINWGELEGSYRGGYSHEEALRRVGYEIVAGSAKEELSDRG